MKKTAEIKTARAFAAMLVDCPNCGGTINITDEIANLNESKILETDCPFPKCRKVFSIHFSLKREFQQ